MGRVIELSDEQYETITRAAASRGTTPDHMLAQLIEGLRDPLAQPRYYETVDWFHHLGFGDEEIADVMREAEADGDADT